MSRLLGSRVLWGLLLILAGVAFLLQNLGFFEFGGLFWGIVLGLGGLAFLGVYFQDRQQWWGLIPGMVLLSVAAIILIDMFFPALSFGTGGIVLGGIGAAFLAVFLADRDNWWALIPMGVMFTLAVVTTLDEMFGLESGGLFFLGLGLTFTLVALVPTPEGRMRWAWIPAAILLVMGVLILAAAEALIGYLWPVALILLGLFLIGRTLLARG